MFVQERFQLASSTSDHLSSMVPKFGYNGFGEIVFYRTYSRICCKDCRVQLDQDDTCPGCGAHENAGQETWSDVVRRVTEGTYSIRKDFYAKNRIPWDENYWQGHAYGFAKSMFEMKWLPPGRGLWAMGSNFVYERGAMALYNCAYTNLTSGADFVEDCCWLMDTLMHGVGVGFNPLADDLKIDLRKVTIFGSFVIPDSREGWIQALRRVLRAYLLGDVLPNFVFDLVRPSGRPIRGFGGVSSGPEPLRLLLAQVRDQCIAYGSGKMNVVEFKTNVANLIGCCVVAGNVRRSAEIACGSIHDEVFMNLKDYNKYPHRAGYGWMSNNSVILDETADFDYLGEIAKRVIHNGEPGVINRRNLVHGRIGKEDGARKDYAIGFNPCGEIPLEHREVCNLAETLPTMCVDAHDWYLACEYATFYASTVSLLPTHQPSTNRIVARNRRIGIGIIDFSGWKHLAGVHKVTKFLRNGYDVVCETNRQLNAEAGVPEAIRKTTIKPGGTTPKLPGKTSGCGHPTFHHTLRRIRVAQNAPIHQLLVDANIPYEKDLYSANTDVFEFPILQGPAKPATEVSLWEQAMTVVLLQREWSDNAVSNTLYFRPMWRLVETSDSGRELLDRVLGKFQVDHLISKKITVYVVPETNKTVISFNGNEIAKTQIFEYDPAHEERDIEPVLSSIIPLIKSVSLLPHSDEGAYPQMVEEGISESEYQQRIESILPIDWSQFAGSDGMDEKFCTGDMCEVPNRGNANLP